LKWNWIWNMSEPKAQPVNEVGAAEPKPENAASAETGTGAAAGSGAETAAPGATAGAAAEAAGVGSVTLSAQEFEELRRKADQAAEHWERLLRTAADFDNFRKRAARERQEVMDYAQQALLTRLIPVLDSFEAALSALNAGDPQSVQNLQQGVQLVWQQLRAVLQEAGLTEVDATGQRFDPALHEAVATEERTDVPDGQVVRQLRKGYKLRDRLLRPASVVVAHPPGRAEQPAAN
jgi:molecular chaperone GrpE